MRRIRDRDDAVPALTLADVVEDGDYLGRLYDPIVNTGEAAAKLRQPTAHAPLPQASILGTVGAIHVACQVVGRRLLSPC